MAQETADARRALETLAERDRQALLMKEEGLNYEEIADVLGMGVLIYWDAFEAKRFDKFRFYFGGDECVRANACSGRGRRIPTKPIRCWRQSPLRAASKAHSGYLYGVLTVTPIFDKAVAQEIAEFVKRENQQGNQGAFQQARCVMALDQSLR